MNKMIKVVPIIFLIVFIMSMVSSIVLANTGDSVDWNIDDYANAGGDSNLNNSLYGVVGPAIVVARVVATGIAVIMLIILATKYIMAAPGDKAEIKKHAVVYVVGAIVMFATSEILGIIAKFASGI